MSTLKTEHLLDAKSLKLLLRNKLRLKSTQRDFFRHIQAWEKNKYRIMRVH